MAIDLNVKSIFGAFSCPRCNLFFTFWHRLMIFGMKLCYYKTVSYVSSWPPCGHWSQCQINFWVHFHIRNVISMPNWFLGAFSYQECNLLYLLTYTYDIWYKCVLPAESVWYIIMAFMWPLISSSNNWFLGPFSYQECNFFIFRYIFMIFSIKVCYQHRVKDVSSWTPCDLWS